MAISQKHIADLFFNCKMDLQRTESLLGADKSKKKPTTTAAMSPEGDDNAAEGRSLNDDEVLVTSQQESLHYQREIVSLFTTVAKKMAASSGEGTGATSPDAIAANFITDSVSKKLLAAVSATSGAATTTPAAADAPLTAEKKVGVALDIPANATSKLKFRLTKGFLKALDMPIEGPSASTSAALAAEKQHQTVRQIIIKHVSEGTTTPSANAAGGSSAAGMHNGSNAEGSDTEKYLRMGADNNASSFSSSSSLMEHLRFLPAGDLSTLVSKLWVRVFSRLVRGVFYTDTYANMLSVGATVATSSTNTTAPSSSAAATALLTSPLQLSAVARALLTADGCAEQLKAVSDAMYLEVTRGRGAMMRQYQPTVFYNTLEASYLSLLSEVVQDVALAKGIGAVAAVNSEESELGNKSVAVAGSTLAPSAWASWYFPLLAVRSLNPTLLSLMLVGNSETEGGQKTHTLSSSSFTANNTHGSGGGATGGTVLARYRALVLRPIVTAAKDVLSVAMANEVPLDQGDVGHGEDDDHAEDEANPHGSYEMRRSAALIRDATKLLTETIALVLTAHYTAAATAAENAEDQDATIRHYCDTLLREELVLPLINTLKAVAEEHKDRVKSFGLPSGVLEGILAVRKHEEAEAPQQQQQAQSSSSSVHSSVRPPPLPSRQLTELLYQPLKAALKPFVSEMDACDVVDGGGHRTHQTTPLKKFAAQHKESCLTMLYHFLSVAMSLADDEEEAIVAATRTASSAATTSGDGVGRKSSAKDGAAAAASLAPASSEAIHHAIKKCFERRSHLIDRSGYDAVGGTTAAASNTNSALLDGDAAAAGGSSPSSPSLGIVYKWNKDVFTAVVGELGFPLIPQGRRPLEDGGHEVFKLVVPRGGGGAPTTRVYSVYVDRGLLYAREEAAVAVTSPTAAAPPRGMLLGGGGRPAGGGMLLGGRPKPGVLGGGGIAARGPTLGGGSSASGTTTNNSGAFAVVEAFERFFGGDKL